MTPEARSRIVAAVELSPGRRCVTIRRDDGRTALAEVDRLTACATRAEAHMAENHRVLAEQERELVYTRTLVEEMGAKIADLTEERDDVNSRLSDAYAGLQKAWNDLTDAETERDQAIRQLSSTVCVEKADLLATWPTVWLSWALLPLTAAIGYFAPHIPHHG